MIAPVPNNEKQRLKVLWQYDVLDTVPEEVFDDLTELAARICGAPIALISLVDENRQWFKSRVGLRETETARDVSFCAHAILQDELFIVRDATKDARFAQSPLVTSEPKIRFYAGAPLITPDGFALGALCVIDRVPRDLTPDQCQGLRVLARHVVSQLELRRHARELASARKSGDQLSRELNKVRGQLATAREQLKSPKARKPGKLTRKRPQRGSARRR